MAKAAKKAVPKKQRGKAKPGDKRIGNKFAVGNNGGQPAFYKTPEEFANAADAYFEYIKGEFHIEKVTVKDPETGEKKLVDAKVWDRQPEPAAITGLVLFLGFSHRCSLDDYQKIKEFSNIVKRARTKVEYAYERRLEEDKPTGAIFALKNMGWVDKTEVKNTNEIFNHNLPDVANLPDEDLETIMEIYKRARNAGGEDL